MRQLGILRGRRRSVACRGKSSKPEVMPSRADIFHSRDEFPTATSGEAKGAGLVGDCRIDVIARVRCALTRAPAFRALVGDTEEVDRARSGRAEKSNKSRTSRLGLAKRIGLAALIRVSCATASLATLAADGKTSKTASSLEQEARREIKIGEVSSSSTVTSG